MAKEDKARSKLEKKETISASVSPELIRRLDILCEERGKYRSGYVEQAIEEFLDREEKKKK